MREHVHIYIYIYGYCSICDWDIYIHTLFSLWLRCIYVQYCSIFDWAIYIVLFSPRFGYTHTHTYIYIYIYIHTHSTVQSLIGLYIWMYIACMIKIQRNTEVGFKISQTVTTAAIFRGLFLASGVIERERERERESRGARILLPNFDASV